MIYTIGIDIGSGAVKSVLFRSGGDKTEWLARRCERIRRRDPMELARQGYDEVLAEAKLAPGEVTYTATTGEGENVKFATGHFYTMTTHARGGVYLYPEARAVLDIGALNGRAIYVDERGKVLSYKMTSQCASGSGQFVENITRYLGVPLEDVGKLSCESRNPEKCSGVCAVLAETDVINMVSRGISTPDILKGIHLSIASKLARLVRAIGADGRVLVTGGMAHDVGFLAALREVVGEKQAAAQPEIEIVAHPESVLAGALGAALLAAHRHRQLEEMGRLVTIAA